MLKYLSLNIVDVSDSPYPVSLKGIKIEIRGTRNFNDIFFFIEDVETSFGITIPPQVDFTWINTASGRERYLSYATLKKILFQFRDKHPMMQLYLSWVDSLICSNSNITQLFRNSYSSTDDSESMYDLDDKSSVITSDSVQDDDSVITPFQYIKIKHKFELQKKDIQILQGELKYKNKEIELLELRLQLIAKSNWI